MKVGVIGGGAAGMVAAITACRDGAAVRILEAGDRLGQKILSTGNGKCNLGNTFLDPSCYHCSDRKVVELCLDRFGTEETLKFFKGIGLMTREKNGYLYPFSEQASSVLDALRNEVKALEIPVIYGFRVSKLQREREGGYLAIGEKRREAFDRVILACGGKAAPKTGSDGSGYELARMLGHRIVPVVPALTFLKCEGDFFKTVSGVRTKAAVTLRGEGGEILAQEGGELQLTDQGLSGIPVFQLSRTAAYALLERKKITAEVDFFPEYSVQELKNIILARSPIKKNRTAEEYFNGLLNKKLMLLFMKRAGIKGSDAAANLSDRKLEEVVLDAKNLSVKVLGTGDYHHAQVCGGGVDLREVTYELESRKASGVYFAGELLDIDGRCGGYNLQWAWSSGYLAGSAAAEGRTDKRK